MTYHYVTKFNRQHDRTLDCKMNASQGSNIPSLVREILSMKSDLKIVTSAPVSNAIGTRTPSTLTGIRGDRV